MGSLRECLRKAGKLFGEPEKKYITELRDNYVKDGMSPEDAALSAVSEYTHSLVEERSEIQRQVEAKGLKMPEGQDVSDIIAKATDKPAEAKGPEVAEKSPEEQWNALAGQRNITTWKGLSEDQRTRIVRAFEKGDQVNLEHEVDRTVKELMGDVETTGEPGGKFSEASAVTPSDRDTIVSTLKKAFFSPAKMDTLVKIHDTVEDARQDKAGATAFAQAKDASRVQAFIGGDGKVHLIAENIEKGHELGVFLHEVGVHLGMEKLVGKANMKWLSDQIDRWAAKDDGSVEARIAKEALARAEDSSSADKTEEKLAYMVEGLVREGVTPQAEGTTEGHRWFRRLWAAAKGALRKLGMLDPDKLTGQHLVDMAYGAAHLELEGGKSTPPTEPIKFSEASTRATISKLPERLREPASRVVSFMRGKKDGFLGAMFLNDVMDLGKKFVPAIEPYYNAVFAQAATAHELSGRVDTHSREFFALKKADYEAVNRAIDFMDDGKKWGYEDSPAGKATVDPEAKRLFDALSPEGQAVVREHFQIGHDMLAKMRDVVIQFAKDAREKAIAEAKGDQKDLDKAEATYKDAERDAHSRFTGNLATPYSPKVRKGDWFLVAKSAKYLEAEAAKDEKAMEAMKSDGAHYVVRKGSRGDMEWEHADKYANDARFKDGLVEAFPQERYVGNEKLDLRQINSLLQAVESNDDMSPKLKKMARESLQQMYLESLSDTSARKAGLKREDIAGYDPDRLGSSIEHYKSMSHLIALMQHGAGVEKLLTDIRAQAHDGVADGKPLPGTKADHKKYANEILFRHALGMVRTNNSVQGAAMKVTAAMRVVTSPAFHFQQLSEPWMVMLPMLASEHGYHKSRATMWAALQEAGAMLNKKNPLLSMFTHTGELDVSKYESPNGDAETARMRRFFAYEMGRGRLDLTQMSNLSNLTESNYLSRVAQLAFRRINQVATNSETINRLTSALSSYRLNYDKAIRDGHAPEAAEKIATDKADKIIARSHGEFEAFASPRFMMQSYWNQKGMPLPVKLIAQFKKFEVMRTTLMARQVHDALHGATPEERRIARAYLKYTFAHYGLMAGAMGLPGYGLASTLIDWIFKDADEAVDPDEHLYEFLRGHVGDDMATLLAKGAPAALGVDVGKKVGAGSLGTGLVGSLDKIDVSDKAHIEETIMGMLGPTIGLATDAGAAVSKIRQGDYQKGMELMLPSLLRNASQAWRMKMGDGLTNSKNDTLVSPEDISALDAAMKVAGFQTTHLELRQMAESSKYGQEDKFKIVEQRLIHKYNKAAKEGDSDAKAEIRDRWIEMQETQRKLGMIATPLSTLLKGPTTQLQREVRTVGGVQYKKNDLNYVRDLTGQ